MPAHGFKRLVGARLKACQQVTSLSFANKIARKFILYFVILATKANASDQGAERELDYLEFAINDNARLILSQGDITKWDGDAIVNAANQRMLGGGGVDGAIHRAAGPELLEACKEVEQIRPGVRCPTGEARITPGFNLQAKYVIHTVGPIFESTAKSAPYLASSYRNSLKLANEKGLKTIAFPAISTGVYGYPIASAAEVSLHAVAMSVGDIEEVHFVLFDTPTFNAFSNAARDLFGERLDEVTPESTDAEL